jgi:hypothetical protein
MTYWEYCFTHITNTNFPDRETAQDLVNRLGRDGWELVGFDVHNQAWFKRPLPDAAVMESASERQATA